METLDAIVAWGRLYLLVSIPFSVALARFFWLSGEVTGGEDS